MRLISINRCQPGERLAKPIYNSNGVTLIGAGVELTQNMLLHLEKMNVTAIYIEDKGTHDIVVEDIVSPETLRETLQLIVTTFESFRSDPTKWTRKIGDQSLGRQFKKVMRAIIDEISANGAAMNLLGSACGVDNYIFAHSFHVTLYSTSLGIKMGYNESQLMELGIGAMLHDIGKMVIPQELLLKPGKLTADEMNEMKKHTEYGFDLLREQEEISLLSAHCAYQHHERLDGSGYPRGLTDEQIHPYAKIIAVCDVFDALTSRRSYREGMLPHQALELIFSGAGILYDREVVERFRDTIALYPIGLSVVLNTGEEAVVVAYNQGIPSRPVVRVLTEPDGTKLSTPYEIDLSKNLQIVIAKCEPIH